MARRHVHIVGGGIAGLTLACALSAQGIKTTVVEQADGTSTVGAGLQLSPNATRILDRLNLASALRPFWHEPHAVSLVSGNNLRPLNHVPLGDHARTRWGAPYAVVHRADLQDVLMRAAEASRNIEIVYGSRVESFEALANLVGHPPSPDDIVVGADGVWSALRASAGQAQTAKFTAYSAWRMQVAPEAFAMLADPDPVTAFLAPGAHLVAYPLPAHGTINLVAIGKGGTASREWNEGSNENLRAELAGVLRTWHPKIRDLVANAAMAGRWPIFTLDRSVWRAGQTILIGDAAHAMTPYAAQGAAMGIEDAYVLARCIAQYPGDREAAATKFSALREPRVARVRKRAAFNRFAYHAAGPVRIARDIVLRSRTPASLAADFDWLYGETSLTDF